MTLLAVGGLEAVNVVLDVKITESDIKHLTMAQAKKDLKFRDAVVAPPPRQGKPGQMVYKTRCASTLIPNLLGNGYYTNRIMLFIPSHIYSFLGVLLFYPNIILYGHFDSSLIYCRMGYMYLP
jgi:hypothetical protein